MKKIITKEDIAIKRYGKSYEVCCSREKARIQGILFSEREKLSETLGVCNK